MISSEQSGRRADGRSVALAIVAVAPVGVVAVFAAGLFVLYQNLLDLDRAVGELEVQMDEGFDGIEQRLDGMERRLARLEESAVALREGQQVILRRLGVENFPPYGAKGPPPVEPLR